MPKKYKRYKKRKTPTKRKVYRKRYKRYKRRTALTELRKLFFIAGAILLSFYLGFWLIKGHAPNISEIIPSSGKYKIAFVIDDMGYTRDYEKTLKKLGRNVTYAVLPLLPYSKHFGELSRKTGANAILHLPLEAIDDTIPGRGLIVHNMSSKEVLETLKIDLASVPNLIGVNNHMGSRGTSDARLMRTILKELKKRNLFFLDSYTTSKSVTKPLGKEIGLTVLERGVFLDNIDSKPYIRSRIEKLKKDAKRNSHAIAIGHYRYNTLLVLSEEIPKLKKEGFSVVSLKNIIKHTKKD